MEEHVPIVWTECHLGGYRPWFSCPLYVGGQSCGRRVAVLYAAGDLFGCRHCYRLAYSTQQQTPHDRNLTVAQKIRTRLGGSTSTFDAFPEKPKGMHWWTYDRLRARAQRAEGICHEFLARWLSRH